MSWIIPNTAGPSSSSLNAQRSGMSISTEPSRRASTRTGPSEKQSEPTTPISPQHRMTRKRAASLNAESAGLPPKLGDLALNSANHALNSAASTSNSNPSSSDLITAQVCLCQPDPKIPRPRNAFILYRQHYQQQVVAHNPGLANPEISKIIGEQWRDQAPEVKNNWKRLAEEEKQRHQRQYPSYRYQPRRSGGRPQGVRPQRTASNDYQVRCPKCNGRYISTPSTPLTPFTPFGPSLTSGPRDDHPLSQYTSVDNQPIPQERLRNLSQVQIQQPGRMDSPRMPPSHQQAQIRVPPQRPQQLITHREHEEEMDRISPSPDLKRRRFNNDPYNRHWASSSPVTYSPQQPYSRGPSMSGPTYRLQPLPGLGQMLVRPPVQGSMGPPPVQSPTEQLYPYQQPRPGFEESLRLPPLQTQVTPSARSSEHRDSQTLGVEAMIMSINFMNKIRVLHKIAPPLRAPGISSPAPAIRGAIVAIEGSDKALLAEIGDFITEYLTKDPSCAVRTWTEINPRTESVASAVNGTDVADVESAKSATQNDGPTSLLDFLSVISVWHARSKEIATYITTPPSPRDLALFSTSSTSQSKWNKEKPKILPIALLPMGFSLTTSDIFSKCIPITDEYAPVDHWQWIATLWRGIIGPDVTVYVTRADKAEVESLGAVQVIKEFATIVVRIDEGGGGMDDVARRRLGFEVAEMAIRAKEKLRKGERRGRVRVELEGGVL